MKLGQLIKKLKDIKSLGFVKTHRAHDTGVGKTLEDLLGIKENNLRIPDVGEIELKAQRLKTSSMLTIATKSPKPAGVNKQLFECYKYKDKNGYYNLHSTVYGSGFNPQGLKVSLKNNKLVLENKNNIEAYWDLTIFDEVLKSKSNKILLVFAETKGEPRTRNECFHYIEAYLLLGLNFKKFEDAIKRDKIKIDIRIGVYRTGKLKGRYHDHGTVKYPVF